MNKILTGLFLFLITTQAFTQETATPQWRPQYHFSSPKNWINDPNGLVYLNGEFNLYYQHNPFENKWGHMSWGHATSKNLVNWKNLPVAIPEQLSKDTTTWMFSGSVVVDKNNTSGFGINNQPPLVAIFTADQPKQHKESQFIAYSNDNGLSYKMYKDNPVVDLNKKDFRDPNVFWHEPSKKWIMAVSLVNEHLISIYGSKDLKEWEKLSDFGPAGNSTRGWECPFLVPIAVDGNPSNIKWVLMISLFSERGPCTQYFVGDFDGKSFKNSNDDNLTYTVDYGDTFYAAIPWRMDQLKSILLGWLVPGDIQTYPWRGQMSIPRDLALKTTKEGIRLYQSPTQTVHETLLRKNHLILSQKKINLKDQVVELVSDGSSNSNSNWISAEFQLKEAKKVGFYITQNKVTNKKIIVGYDALKQEIYVDFSSAGDQKKSVANLFHTAPIKPEGGVIKLEILLDKNSLEIFGNDGEKVITTMVYPENRATGISAFSEGTAVIKNLKMWNLE